MISCYLVKLSFVRNFHDKIMFFMRRCFTFNLILFDTLKKDCGIEKSEILGFCSLKNNSVVTGLGYSHLNFHKNHQFFCQ